MIGRNKTKKIVLYGAGGFARELTFMIERINELETSPRYSLLGFIVSDKEIEPGTTLNGYPILGSEDWLLAHKDEVVCTCAIAKSPKLRKEIQERLESQGVKFETLIAKDVTVHPTTRIGGGSVIGTGVLLSVNMRIGKGVVINSRSLLGHDTVIGDYSCIMCGCNISGGITVGECVSVGNAATVIPGRKIGSNSVIAAGSVVFTNVKDGTKVLGNPAKKIDI